MKCTCVIQPAGVAFGCSVVGWFLNYLGPPLSLSPPSLSSSLSYRVAKVTTTTNDPHSRQGVLLFTFLTWVKSERADSVLHSTASKRKFCPSPGAYDWICLFYLIITKKLPFNQTYLLLYISTLKLQKDVTAFQSRIRKVNLSHLVIYTVDWNLRILQA